MEVRINALTHENDVYVVENKDLAETFEEIEGEKVYLIKEKEILQRVMADKLKFLFLKIDKIQEEEDDLMNEKEICESKVYQSKISHEIDELKI